jgi:MFS family permease
LVARVSEEAHRNIWTATGAAGFVAGVVIAADWIGTVVAAPKDRHLSVNYPIFYVAVALMVLGIIAFLAALTDAPWLWLPGKRAVRLHRLVLAGLELKKEGAVTILVAASGRGRSLELDAKTTHEEVVKWTEDVYDLVYFLWGLSEAARFGSAARVRDLQTGDLHTLIVPTMTRIDDLLVRCLRLALTHEALDMSAEDLRTWLDRFREP